MTTLSDTPTSIPSVAADISIKIEQGVLYEDNYDEGSKTKVEMRDASKPVHDLNLLPAAGHMLNITHSIFQSDFSIKTEPEVDIDDRQPDEEVEEKVHPELQPNNDVLSKIPKIRPTPTNKLIANWVSGNKRRFACTYENCTKSYGKSSHLRSHLTWHTGIKPFVCKEPACGKGFTRSDELNRHIRTHTGEKPFECVKCTKKFSRSDHLTKHLATHSKQLSASPLMKKLKTENNVSFSAFKTLLKTPLLGTSGNQNSQEIHLGDRFEPNIDCLKAASEESLIIKQEITESNADCMTNTPNLQKNLNLSFPSEHGLLLKNDYNVVIKPEPAQEPQVSQPLVESNEPDDDAIMPEANLPPILQNSTSIPVLKSEESSLLKVSTHHMTDSVYDPTRPFPCCHCTKNFKRQDDLNRHMRTHTGEKPFACIECEKRFMRSDHLKKHIKTHAKTR